TAASCSAAAATMRRTAAVSSTAAIVSCRSSVIEMMGKSAVRMQMVAMPTAMARRRSFSRAAKIASRTPEARAIDSQTAFSSSSIGHEWDEPSAEWLRACCGPVRESCSLFRRSDFLRQYRQELHQICDDADRSRLKDRRLGVLVDRQEEGVALDAAEVLEGAADAESEIDLRLDGLSRGANLARLVEPFRVDDGARAGECGAHRFAQLFDERQVFLVADAAADGDEHLFLRDVDVAGFGLNELDEAAARRDSGHGCGVVNELTSFRRLGGAEDAGANCDHGAPADVAVHVRADLAGVLLAHGFQRRPFDAVEADDVRHIGRADLHRESGAEVEAEGVVGKEDDRAGGDDRRQERPQELGV